MRSKKCRSIFCEKRNIPDGQLPQIVCKIFTEHKKQWSLLKKTIRLNFSVYIYSTISTLSFRQLEINWSSLNKPTAKRITTNHWKLNSTQIIGCLQRYIILKRLLLTFHPCFKHFKTTIIVRHKSRAIIKTLMANSSTK